MMTGAAEVKRAKDEVLIEQGKKNTKLIRVKTGSLRIEKVCGANNSLLMLISFFRTPTEASLFVCSKPA